jgi:hypothetical protein
LPRSRLALITAVAFVAVVAVSAVVAMVTGDARLSALLVHRTIAAAPEDFTAGPLLVLVAVGVLQGWGLWQILSVRQAAERPDRAARWLRIALYLTLALTLADLSWTDIPEDIARIAVVMLFYRVVRGVSRLLRVAVLVTGLYFPVLLLNRAVQDLLGFDGEVVWRSAPGEVAWLIWLVWMTLTLVAQAKDGRWSGSTLRVGAAIVVLPFVAPYLDDPFGDAYLWYDGLRLASDVFMLVWLGRSAREVGNRPGDPRPVPAARPLRLWPLQAVAVALPLLPVAVNLADGVVRWIGPRGAIASWMYGPGGYLLQFWNLFDILVGLGGAVALVLAAVLRRTRGLVLGTIGALLLTAAAGLVSAVTATTEPTFKPDHVQGTPRFPARMLSFGLGISPLWHSAALTCSALLLLFLYGDRPARRMPYQAVPVGIAVAVALALLPASDYAPGRTTTVSDCEPEVSPTDEYLSPSPMTAERAFICDARASRSVPYAENMPDRELVAYGHRLCGVYTRDDPAETALFRQTHGVDPREQAALLDVICPKADEVIDAAMEEEEREMLAAEADEQAKCDTAPRHRPLIEPVAVSREKRPIWPELPLEAYEGEGMPQYNMYERKKDDDLVLSAPGHLMIFSETELRICVTTETYDRRPPVETKGWHHVVEVGYQSLGGDILLADHLSAVELPAIALKGKGHYRIRVHHAWIPWKGNERSGQRLLIMAYPGRGDDVIVHRKPTR